MLDTAAIYPSLFLQRPGMPPFFMPGLLWRNIRLFLLLCYQGRQGATRHCLDWFNAGHRSGFPVLSRPGYWRRKAGYILHDVKRKLYRLSFGRAPNKSHMARTLLWGMKWATAGLDARRFNLPQPRGFCQIFWLDTWPCRLAQSQLPHLPHWRVAPHRH